MTIIYYYPKQKELSTTFFYKTGRKIWESLSYNRIGENNLHFLLRDRPFNLKGGLWFFVSFRIFFSDNPRVRIVFFFQNLTLGYMTKTLNQIIFFFLHQNYNIFFSNIGNQNIFLGKKHNPPFKLNGRSLNIWHFTCMRTLGLL